MTNFYTFTLSNVSNPIHFQIIWLVILPLSNFTSKLFSILFTYIYNVIKENIVLTFLTCNITLYIYSSMTISSYIYLYDGFSSGAPTPRFLARTSGVLSVMVHQVLHSVLWTRTLHPIKQRQERLPDTYDNRNADTHLPLKILLANVIPHCTFRLVTYKYLSICWTTLMQRFSQDLKIWICPSLPLSLREALTGSKPVNKLLDILLNANFDSRLVFTLATGLNRWHDVHRHTVKEHRSS